MQNKQKYPFLGQYSNVPPMQKNSFDYPSSLSALSNKKIIVDENPVKKPEKRIESKHSSDTESCK